MKNSHIGIAAALALTVATACRAPLNEQLAGRWGSPGCEPAGGGAYLTRDFTLTESTWNLDVAIWDDASCQMKLAGVRVAGPYEVLGDSAAVPGASEANYQITTLTATPASEAAVLLMTQAGCGSGARSVGQPVDISATGCAPFGAKSVAACPMELDLTQIDGNNLYFGDRSADLCKMRPSKLSAMPVVKQ